MFARLLALAVASGLICFSAGVAVAGEKDAKDQGDKDKSETKVFAIPKDAVAGKMLSVNVKVNTITFTVKASGKERTFKVDKETKFIGPRGGPSEEGIKDDRLNKGYEVFVLADSSGDVAREVHLPFRMKTVKDKKDKKEK